MKFIAVSNKGGCVWLVGCVSHFKSFGFNGIDNIHHGGAVATDTGDKPALLCTLVCLNGWWRTVRKPVEEGGCRAIEVNDYLVTGCIQLLCVGERVSELTGVVWRRQQQKCVFCHSSLFWGCQIDVRVGGMISQNTRSCEPSTCVRSGILLRRRSMIAEIPCEVATVAATSTGQRSAETNSPLKRGRTQQRVENEV